MPRLADAEDDARQHEGDDRPGETVRDMPDGPDRNGDRIADLGAEAVDQPAHEQKTQRIGELEGGDDVAIVVLGPFQLVAERRREQPEHGAVDIIDRGDRKSTSLNSSPYCETRTPSS